MDDLECGYIIIQIWMILYEEFSSILMDSDYT